MSSSESESAENVDIAGIAVKAISCLLAVEIVLALVIIFSGGLHIPGVGTIPAFVGWMIFDWGVFILGVINLWYFEMYSSLNAFVIVFSVVQCVAGVLLWCGVLAYDKQDKLGNGFLGYLLIFAGSLVLIVAQNIKIGFHFGWTLLSIACFQIGAGILMLTEYIAVPADLQDQYKSGNTPTTVYGIACIGLGILFGSLAILALVKMPLEQNPEEEGEREPICANQSPSDRKV
eukprot:gnl/TRDRNA2_/TRDRNA2_141624_c0_seq6.p1 gnl/TRDRNA2_/TRDRNA2_141624_c0~~gnl/TRDRNA2_/TRDRNA2_141624_c0_seq6.p1  ORF type:complete len:232 (-),score=36.32 gnl/TRDRNA2_/TRDRNA2_141624_c0_seq6:310-1005(-)